MENISSTGGLGEWVSFGNFTFKNVTNQMRTVTDPAEIQKFKEHSIVFNPTKEESVDKWQPYFSDAALTESPVTADVKKEIDAQATTAINTLANLLVGGSAPEPL